MDTNIDEGVQLRPCFHMAGFLGDYIPEFLLFARILG